LRTGLLGWLIWSGRVLLHVVELIGQGEIVQLAWGLIFRLRPLTAEERAASASVHPANLIPYWQVRVDDDSCLIKIGVLLADLFKTKITPGAITSMHIVHAPAAGLSMPLAVHELDLCRLLPGLPRQTNRVRCHRGRACSLHRGHAVRAVLICRQPGVAPSSW
jgi:hypothetical protein